MNRIFWTTLTVIAVTTVFVIPFLTTDLNSVEGQNTTSQNTDNTHMIVNVTDKTVRVVNTATNETISIRNLTADTENMIINESKSTNNLTVGTENMINNESLSGNNITENAENTTTNLNLTEKFKELTGQ